MIGQKKDPKDVKTQPQEEFISPYNNRPSSADHQKQAQSKAENLSTGDINEKGSEANKRDDQPQNGQNIVTEEKKKKPMDINR
jgi:hypothetical protein